MKVVISLFIIGITRSAYATDSEQPRRLGGIVEGAAAGLFADALTGSKGSAIGAALGAQHSPGGAVLGGIAGKLFEDKYRERKRNEQGPYPVAPVQTYAYAAPQPYHETQQIAYSAPPVHYVRPVNVQPNVVVVPQPQPQPISAGYLPPTFHGTTAEDNDTREIMVSFEIFIGGETKSIYKTKPVRYYACTRRSRIVADLLDDRTSLWNGKLGALRPHDLMAPDANIVLIFRNTQFDKSTTLGTMLLSENVALANIGIRLKAHFNPGASYYARLGKRVRNNKSHRARNPFADTEAALEVADHHLSDVRKKIFDEIYAMASADSLLGIVKRRINNPGDVRIPILVNIVEAVNSALGISPGCGSWDKKLLVWETELGAALTQLSRAADPKGSMPL